VLNVINFFSRLVPVLVAEQILTELTPSTVCFRGEEVKLCDYNLLFYPRNRRSD